MKLVDTTDERYTEDIGREYTLTYNGGSAYFGFETDWIRTSKVKQITREGNRVVITTVNNTYTLED